MAYHSHEFGNLIKGRAHLIVKDGQPLEHDLRQSHISEHDLIEQLRQHGLDDLKQVRAAYKERSGEVSVLKKKEPPQTIDIAVQDGVQTVRLQLE